MSGDAAAGGVPASSAGETPRNIILVGYRGSGKSAVGAALAQRLGWTLVDTDADVERAAGCTIREIFATAGEPAFRTREAEAVAAAVAGVHRVISVGGGAVLRADNRSALRAAGVVIWLTAPAAELWQRMQHDPRNAATRPALTADGGLAEVQNLLTQREPLYAASAHHTLATSGRSIAELVTAILKAVGVPIAPQEDC